jgi:endonuclease G, mitochondrial
MATLDEGYRKNFLGNDHLLKPPVLNSKQKKDLVKFDQDKYVLDYIHYSVVMSKIRRFAYYTAVNIDGKTWRDNPRKGRWKKDTRIKEQFGDELYGAKKSDFDKGHLVRREDPEWGDKTVAVEAGENTFRYPNCVPQHKKLNQEIWAELENNILHKGAADQHLKISVFTGPVLSDNDGIFVTKVNDEEVKIPNLFWKVVTWVKSDGKMYAVGFVQSQEKFLIEGGIIRKLFVPLLNRLRNLSDEDIFEHIKFKDGKTYQVRIEDIESITGMKFDWPDVIKPYKKTEPSLIRSKKQLLGHRIKNRQKSLLKREIKLDLEGLELG